MYKWNTIEYNKMHKWTIKQQEIIPAQLLGLGKEMCFEKGFERVQGKSIADMGG